ncbi:MAG: alpha/beta hydrolase, partial [Mycobacteriales bacterium]
ACSGGSTGDPGALPGSPSPTTAAPSSTSTPTAAPTATNTKAATPALSRGVLSPWKSCDGGGFQCATLTVRLDEKDPAKGTVALAMTRHKATGGSRIGSLFVNPGGPGASAVEYLQAAYTGIPQPLRQRFDLVAFDPRGVGRTAPVRCETTAQLDVYFHLDPVPDNDQELTALDRGNRQLAAGCVKRSGRILPYVGTDVVAQDLERARIAVGDAQLTYLGYSYGTAIGAAYLDQFPTHVRAMVLDGALDPSNSWDQLLAGQSRGFDVALGAFLANCQKTTCEFRKKVNGDLTKAYDQLAAKVETHPLSGNGNRVVGPAEFSYGVGQALYSTSLWPSLAQALTEAVDGEGGTLLSLNDNYLERSDSGYANLIESNFAVNCIDRPWPREVAPYQKLAREVGRDYPRFGPAIALSGLGCAVWPLEPTSTPHKVTAPGSPPVVVIGTTRDPATPYSWAQALAGQLSKGVLLTYNGDGHTVYRASAQACITSPVNAYLVNLKVPQPVRC